ncbi:MAG: rod-binding protein [Firmicutes bacterium]|nr:rod-binding protein [Bacillota bacterium]
MYNVELRLPQTNSANNSQKNTINAVVPEEQGFEEKLKRAMENKDEKALKETCQQFEELFLQMMYRQMKATVPKSGLFSENISTEIFDSMLDESLMKEASKANGVGLADMMYKQLYKKMYNTYKIENE